ncbi:hypothetical protein PsorP6_014934 [Peronosclerospora sorghi]|uniref:Uncharacterized protein n=1 Tax=Peronosclerospora sorghi TaxID=230839 RepID=A0ACC0VS12_9STRA|nr:hypothetical protein PsorP6_014934 [Peronosclerospora sorghi]
MRVSLFVGLFVATSVTCSIHSTSAQSTYYKHPKEKKIGVRVLRADLDDDLDEEERKKALDAVDGLISKWNLLREPGGGAQTGEGIETALRINKDEDLGKAAAAEADDGAGAATRAAAEGDQAANRVADHERLVADLKKTNNEKIAAYRRTLTDDENKALDFLMTQVREAKLDESKTLGANLELVDAEEAKKRLNTFLKDKKNKKALKTLTPAEVLKAAGVIGKNADEKVVNAVVGLGQTLDLSNPSKKELFFKFLKYMAVAAIGVYFGAVIAHATRKHSVSASTSTTGDLEG